MIRHIRLVRIMLNNENQPLNGGITLYYMINNVYVIVKELNPSLKGQNMKKY